MADDSQKQSSTAVALPNKAQLEAAYKAVIEGDTTALPTPSDPEVMSRLILERIAAAQSFEEAFRPQKVPAWSEWGLNQVVLVRDVHFNRSGFDSEQGGAPIYAIIDLVDAKTGEAATVHCGGRNVLVQLIKMLEQGWQDRPVKLSAKTTGEGYTALWLEAA